MGFGNGGNGGIVVTVNGNVGATGQVADLKAGHLGNDLDGANSVEKIDFGIAAHGDVNNVGIKDTEVADGNGCIGDGIDVIDDELTAGDIDSGGRSGTSDVVLYIEVDKVAIDAGSGHHGDVTAKVADNVGTNDGGAVGAGKRGVTADIEGNVAASVDTLGVGRDEEITTAVDGDVTARADLRLTTRGCVGEDGHIAICVDHEVATGGVVSNYTGPHDGDAAATTGDSHVARILCRGAGEYGDTAVGIAGGKGKIFTGAALDCARYGDAVFSGDADSAVGNNPKNIEAGLIGEVEVAIDVGVGG